MFVFVIVFVFVFVFKAKVATEFKMKDLGALTHIMEVEVKRVRRNRVLTLHQGSYMRQVL